MAQEKLIYGTAWKGEQTADLVYLALQSGFRAIATAAQPKHYREDLVGEGIRRAISHGLVTRRDLFIQTTFTPYPSQDPADLPYDPKDTLETQVATSLARSLTNLATSTHSAPAPPPEPSYLDALILHIPYPDPQHTKQVWTAMSRAVNAGHVRQLGLSNVSLSDLTGLMAWCEEVREENPDVQLVRPTIVQNRFHPGPEGDFDRAVRLYCCCSSSCSDDATAYELSSSSSSPPPPERVIITYQAFSVLRNTALVQDQASVGVVARILRVSPQVALYALMMEALDPDQADVRVLDGTTKEERMREDVQGVGRALAALRLVKRCSSLCGAEQPIEAGGVAAGDGLYNTELYQATGAFQAGFGEGNG